MPADLSQSETTGDVAEVWKWTMSEPRTVCMMPRYATPLAVGVQGEQIVLWAELYPSQDRAPRTFEAVNTGAPLPEDRRAYVGTAQVGAIVWHVYEVQS